jgi:hypothetical protein
MSLFLLLQLRNRLSLWSTNRQDPRPRWHSSVRSSGGRANVYALRWENERTGKSGWAPAVRGGPGNARKPDREYLPLSDEVVAAHLAGSIHAGLYPLLPNDTCRVLACDFDGNGWALDAL